MTSFQETISDVRAVLQKFQDGYTRRNPDEIDAFMGLFIPDDSLEIIGTNASQHSPGEWCIGVQMARELVENDWRYWGDVRIAIDAANIHTLGDVAWLAAPGTVSMHFDTGEEYQDYLEVIRTILEQDGTPQEKVLRIQFGCASTVYELSRGEDFVWPFRFTAVLVKREAGWLFHQMQFSFPTTRFPDERILSAGTSFPMPS